MKKRTYIIMNICSVLMIIFTFSVIFLNVKDTYSSNSVSSDCSSDAVLQLAKIIYKEVGGETASDSTLNFYRQITTGSIVLNNAFSKSGDTIYEKICNLTDSNYSGYSRYKDYSFDDITSDATAEQKGELLYISQLILSNKYNLPKNIIYQASRSVLATSGAIVWDYTESISGLHDVYWGYDGELSTVDVFGNTINDTSSTYYRNLSESLKKDSYSKFTVDNVCNVSLNDDYTVNFYYDEDLKELYRKMTGNENVSVILPPNPEKEGYTFKHWKDGNGNIVTEPFNPNSDRNLYAVWEKIPKEYTVNFYYDEDVKELYKKVEVVEGNSVKLPANPTKDGYEFKGWVTDNDIVFDVETKITKNIDLYASWKLIENFDKDEELKNEENSNINEVLKEQEKVTSPNTGVFNILWIFVTCILAFSAIIFYFKRIKSQNNF